jgi:hypothetical protein
MAFKGLAVAPCALCSPRSIKLSIRAENATGGVLRRIEGAPRVALGFTRGKPAPMPAQPRNGPS